MADDEQSASGMVSGLAQDFIAQLRAVTQGLEDLAGFGARRPLTPGTFALPCALSAAQLTAISGSVAAQRRSIEALSARSSGQRARELQIPLARRTVVGMWIKRRAVPSARPAGRRPGPGRQEPASWLSSLVTAQPLDDLPGVTSPGQ